MIPFAEIKTKGGYAAGEVASAIQKCIRRGLTDEALFWATELDLSGFGEYVFKRLRIIASEDIGPADHQACQIIHALSESYTAQKKKADSKHAPERLFLVHAIIYLAEAPKSRKVDHALICMYEGAREERQIPDFALDRHTSRGRQARRSWKHFWQEGARLANPAPVNDSYAQRAREIRREAQMDFDLELP